MDIKASPEASGVTIKRIFHLCIGENCLASEVRSSGDEAECDYCGENTLSISIGELAE